MQRFAWVFPLTLQEPGVGRPVADPEFMAIWIPLGHGKSIQLTPRFTEAVDYARLVHVELRKGT